MQVPQNVGPKKSRTHITAWPTLQGPLKCQPHVGTHNSVDLFFFNLDMGSTIRGPVLTQNWTHDATTLERDPLLIQLSFG
jgi:hypothetical protein